MRRLIIAMAVLTLAVSFSTINTSGQTQVIIFPSSSSNLTFGPGGSGSVAMCTSTCTLTSSFGVVFGSGGSPMIGSGSYTLNFGAASLTQSGTDFTVASGGTETLTYTDTSGGGGSVTMTLQLTLVTGGGTIIPQLSGTYVVTSATGNLSSLFSGSNDTGTWNTTLLLEGGCTLDTIAAGTCMTPTTGRILVGTTLGSTPTTPTPEPSSMLLFGTGLLACGVILRRHLV